MSHEANRDGRRARLLRRAIAAAPTALLTTLPTAARSADASGGDSPVAGAAELLERLLPQVLFDYQILGIELWQWLGLILLAFLVAALSWALAFAVVRVLRPIAARTDTSIDDELLASAAAPLRLGIAVALFRVGLGVIALAPGAHAPLSNLLSGLFVVAVAWLLVRATDVLALRIESTLESQERTEAIALVPPGRKAVKVAITALAAVAVLDTFGFSITALVTGLGVGGIAVALAAQKTVENLFGGFTLFADRPIAVGDFGRFGDMVGTVEEIGLRSTRVRTLDRTLVTIPNAEFSAMHIESFAARDRIRFYTMIGLRYETTPEQLRHVLVEVRRLLYSHERVTRDPARIRFVGYGAYSLDLELFAYVDTADWNEFLGIREDLLLRIMDIIAESGTGFAFPSQTLYLGRDEAPSEERQAEIAEVVEDWREQGELYLPSFPEKAIDELAGSVKYPPQGSPGK